MNLTQTDTVHIPISLYDRCLEWVKNQRPHKPKGDIAQGYIGFLLRACGGRLEPDPDLNGKTPDYEWIVAPKLEGSRRFLVEVVYLSADKDNVAQVLKKVNKYKPFRDPHQCYVVAVVYDEEVELEALERECGHEVRMSFKLDIASASSLDDISTDISSVPRAYANGYASGLWFVPFPENRPTPTTLSVKTKFVTINSANAPRSGSGMTIFSMLLRERLARSTVRGE